MIPVYVLSLMHFMDLVKTMIFPLTLVTFMKQPLHSAVLKLRSSLSLTQNDSLTSCFCHQLPGREAPWIRSALPRPEGGRSPAPSGKRKWLSRAELHSPSAGRQPGPSIRPSLE